MLPKRRSSVDTMDDLKHSNSGSAGGDFVEVNSQPHIVVACPSCKTKFAVESSLVASYELPRFHCSRCDAIFELQPQNSTRTQHSAKTNSANPQPAQRWVLDDDRSTTRRESPRNDDYKKTVQTQTTLRATDFSLGTIPNSESGVDTLQPRTPFDPVEDQAGLSILGFRPSASRRYTTSITRAEAQAIATNAHSPANDRTEPTPEPLERSDDPFALFDTPGTHASQPIAPSQFSLSRSPNRLNPSDPSTTDTAPSARPAATPAGAARQIPESPQTQTPATETTPASPQLGESINKPRAGRLSGLSLKNQGLVKIAVPLVAVMGFLATVSVATRIMPLTIDSLFGSVTPGFISGRAAHVPPRELSVQDLNLNLEKTQSKETIPVIRGFVSNISDKTFEDISIEALGFNARGELLVRARAPLRSALSREKISDLPLETVKKFQNVLSASDASIKGGEKVAFAVALFVEGVEPHEVTYFSARVFSVGRTR